MKVCSIIYKNYEYSIIVQSQKNKKIKKILKKVLTLYLGYDIITKLLHFSNKVFEN